MKSLPRIKGLRDVGSVHFKGIRSIPKAQRSKYLDLYMLRREKDRLDREVLELNRKKRAAAKQLKSVNFRIDQLLRTSHDEQKIKTHQTVPTRPLKTMGINY